MKGYFDTKINKTYFVKVDNIHTLYVEECGNPDGQPILFIHGGPGGSISPYSRHFFDPTYYRIILFDQRGTGKSQPFLNLENNTVFDSVFDIEKIREELLIDSWMVFGGSYGSTLALAYAIQFPERVQHLILRGIFLGRNSDINWLCKEGASYFYPKEFEVFKSYIPVDEQDDLVKAYYLRMIGDNQLIADEACLQWSRWESSIIKLVQDLNVNNELINDNDRSIGLLEAHYFVNHMFWQDDNYLLNNVDKIKKIPMDIVHGRYDVDCRPSGAFDLKKHCPNAHLHFVDMGAHSPYDEAMFNQLVQILDDLKY